MESLIQNEKRCYLCDRKTGLEKHHIFAGVANRKISEAMGFWCFLCHDCHVGYMGAQYNKDTGLMLKRDVQRAFEETHTRDEWMSIIRKNYL